MLQLVLSLSSSRAACHDVSVHIVTYPDGVNDAAGGLAE